MGRVAVPGTGASRSRFRMDFLSVGNEQWETQYLDLRAPL